MFGAGLERRGFERVDGRTWRGTVPVVGLPTPHEVTHVVRLPEDFPFRPPAVTPDPPLDGPLWHMEPSGALCLYPPTGATGRPWDDPEAFIAKVGEWHRQTVLGWPDDPGDLDLERYFKSHNGGLLVVFDDLERLVGRRLNVNRPWPGVVEVERGGLLVPVPGRRVKKSERAAARKGAMWGAAVDLGVLERPVNDWLSLIERLPVEARRAVTALAQARTQGVLVAKYGRHSADGIATGAVALLIRKTPGVVPKATALQVEDRTAARRNRSGSDAPSLAQKSVAVVGVGAVGSFLSECLARSGVGRLTLVDGDRLRYGNTVRHLADETIVGQNKAEAVKDILLWRLPLQQRQVHAVADQLTPEGAVDVLGGHDLVVDATASSRVGDALAHFSDYLGIEWVKVGIHRDGAVLRVDRFGPGTTPNERRPPRVAALQGHGGARETGCGDPVSPTPPYAVQRAATLACAFVVDTLTRRRRHRYYNDTVVETIAHHDAPDGYYGEPGMVQG